MNSIEIFEQKGQAMNSKEKLKAEILKTAKHLQELLDDCDDEEFNEELLQRLWDGELIILPE